MSAMSPLKIFLKCEVFSFIDITHYHITMVTLLHSHDILLMYNFSLYVKYSYLQASFMDN